MTEITEQLLTNEAATGGWVKVGKGGSYVFDAVGTFGGATVKLQRLASDGATALDVGAGATFTEPSHVLVSIAPGEYRAHVEGGTPSGLYSALGPSF